MLRGRGVEVGENEGTCTFCATPTPADAVSFHVMRAEKLEPVLFPVGGVAFRDADGYLYTSSVRRMGPRQASTR